MYEAPSMPDLAAVVVPAGVLDGRPVLYLSREERRTGS
jgi:hypothetical protein